MVLLTISRVPQLSTHHSSIHTFPGVWANNAPHIVHADLHSAFIVNVTSCQSQPTSYTGSYLHKQRSIIIMWLGGQVTMGIWFCCPGFLILCVSHCKHLLNAQCFTNCSCSFPYICNITSHQSLLTFLCRKHAAETLLGCTKLLKF